MSNGNDITAAASLIQSLPVWARLLVIFGPNFAFTAVLLAAIMGWIDNPMTRAMTQNAEMIQVIRVHDNSSIQLRRELLAAFEYNNLLVRTLCKNMVPATAQFQCEPRYRGYDESANK